MRQKIGYHSYMTKPLLIDTHAHINFNAYKDDGDEVIKESLSKGVWMINVGAEQRTSQRAVDYAQKYPRGVYAAVGLHPSHLKEQTVSGEVDNEKIEYQSRQEEIEAEKYFSMAQNRKVVAIGEAGLDYKLLEKEDREAKEKQKEAFWAQLDLARQIDKPIIVHCREAYGDLLKIIEGFQIGCGNCPFACAGSANKQIKGTMHCFVGSKKQAERFLDWGFYFGFNGIITFSRDYDAVIKSLPLERILLETDCPFLAPVPYRGQRNKPAYVKYVAEKLAEIKGASFEDIAKQTTKNAKELFGIN